MSVIRWLRSFIHHFTMKEPFINHVLSNYREHCLDNFLAPGSANLLEFLINSHLIYDNAIREYVVKNDFEYLYHHQKYKNKTQTVKALARKYCLHENTIWSIITRKSQNGV